jgi:sulfide:quinone oxidoreductase
MNQGTSMQATVLVIGGGAGGLSAAGRLLKQRPQLDVAVIEPSEHHFYQPAWTLVGGGAYDIHLTRRPEAECVPRGAKWIRAKVADFEPQHNRVALEDGSRVGYRYLIVAAGIQLDWSKIEGLETTLGKNGVTSNYRFDLAPYTWECVRKFKGGTALFTQPAMPIKCAGAPQKILYLACDHWRRQGVAHDARFLHPGGAMFGVPFYAQALDKVIAHYAAKPQFGHNLVAVDGPRRQAVFEVGTDKKRLTMDFEMLHVVPPQSAPTFIKNSPLANEAGWLAVDKHTLRHDKYDNVFGLGDCTSTPNSKTAAAVRAQTPVLVANVLAAMVGKPLEARYDGYASCPLTTSRGKVMLAEFAYDGVVTPSFPFDPRVPRRAYWWLKKSYLPRLYWRMLHGHLGPDWHAKRDFQGPVPELIP